MLRNAAALLLGCALSIGLLETGLRISGRFPSRGLHTVSAEDYERIPGMWEPGQDFVNTAKPLLAHRIHTNALGLRGPETTLLPTGPRVLCLGDSFTFGDFASDDETLPAQLSRRLGDGAEVLNGGVGGTTIVDQRVFLERYLALRPDLVLLLYYENDVGDLLKQPARHAQLANNRRLKSGPLAGLYRIARDTATFNALLEIQARMRERVPDARAAMDADEPRNRVGPPLLPPEAVDRYAALVAEMRERLEALDIGLLVAAYPHPFSVSGKWKVDRIGPVARALAARDIALLDLTPALRDSGLPITELYLLPHDGHPSARGYAVAAEALAPHVARALAAREARTG